MTVSITPTYTTIQPITGTNYAYQSTDSGSIILRSNNGESMDDTLLILPLDTIITIKVTENLGNILTITCGDSALIDLQQSSIIVSGLSCIRLASDGANWWLV